jgi:hypothetical protein
MSKVTSIRKNEVGRVKSLDFGTVTSGGDSGIWDAEINAFMDNQKAMTKNQAEMLRMLGGKS